MAEVIVNDVGAILGKIAELLVVPVGRQFGYVFCFSKKIDQLSKEAEKLENKRAGLQHEVDNAETNNGIIKPEVVQWLVSAGQVVADAEEIKQQMAQVIQIRCLNMKLRYTLGRKASKKIQEVVKLRREGKFETVAIGAPPPGACSIPIPAGDFNEGLESRVSSVNQIIELLKDDQIRAIVIHGMGGVGKTTLVKKVAERAKVENLFDEIAMAVISQNMNEEQVQRVIAEMLGLELEEQNLIARGGKLRQRLVG